jgi:hypothetical protein
MVSSPVSYMHGWSSIHSTCQISNYCPANKLSRDNEIMAFVNENCVVFDSEEENKSEYSIVHQKFQELVDCLLTAYLGQFGLTPEAFAEACEPARYASRHNKAVFEQLMAMEDFLTCKKLMVKRNMELKLEAAQMMQQESGIEFLGLWRDTSDRAMPIKMNVNPGNKNQVSG